MYYVIYFYNDGKKSEYWIKASSSVYKTFKAIESELIKAIKIVLAIKKKDKKKWYIGVNTV